MYARRDENNPWLFPSPRGPGYFANPQKLLDEAKASTNMPDFKFHDLRHYFISNCLLSGIDTLTVASWVGHSGGQLIFSTYGHVNSQHKRDAAAKLQFDVTAAASELAPVPDLSKMSAADLLALLQKVIPPAHVQSIAAISADVLPV